MVEALKRRHRCYIVHSSESLYCPLRHDPLGRPGILEEGETAATFQNPVELLQYAFCVSRVHESLHRIHAVECLIGKVKLRVAHLAKRYLALRASVLRSIRGRFDIEIQDINACDIETVFFG